MYDPQIGRWISEDPIGFGGDRGNLARYVGNRPVMATDPTGLVIQINENGKAELDKMLSENGVSGWKTSSLGQLKVYGPTASYDPKSLRSEILGRMINSGRKFTFSSFAQLKQHVEIREKIVANAKSAPFGFGDNFPTRLFTKDGDRLKVTPFKGSKAKTMELFFKKEAREEMMKFKFRCLNGTVLAVLEAVVSVIGHSAFDEIATADPLVVVTTGKPSGIIGQFIDQGDSKDPNDWVPGDWGYIWNMLDKENQKNGVKTPVGEEGINFIYLGEDKFWSHGMGIVTMAEMQAKAEEWSEGLGATLQGFRRCPSTKLGPKK